MTEPKKRKITKGSYKERFIQHFGKQIDEYISFKRSIAGLKNKTKFNYALFMSNFCLYLNEDPDTIINNRINDLSNKDIFERKNYERKIKDYIQELETKKVSVQPVLNVIGGFFKNNDDSLRIHLGNDVKYSKKRKLKKYGPTCEQVRKVLSVANCKRDEFIVVLAYHCGLTPKDISMFCIGDYPVEPWKYFINSRGKTGATWHGVSTPEGCRYLREYMVIRGGKKGEPLLMGREGPLNEVAVAEVLSILIKRADLGHIDGFTAKSFRDGRFNALRTAEVDIQIREAMMGHTSNIYHQYGTDDELAKVVINAMEKVYPLIRLTDAIEGNGGGGGDVSIMVLLQKLTDRIEAIEQEMRATKNRQNDEVSVC